MTRCNRARLGGLSLAALLWVAGCAQSEPAHLGYDLRPAGDLATAAPIAGDLASAPVSDLSVPLAMPKTSPGVDLATPPPPDLGATGCNPVINELATGTTLSGLDEFVELYNPCPAQVDLTGWKLVYRSAGGSSELALVADLARQLPAGGFLLYGGAGYYDATKDATMASGLAAAGGGVGLRDATGALADSVGWGSASNALVRGGVAPAPMDVAPPGRSIMRVAGAPNSGNNASDFKITSDPTPRATNVLQ